MLHFSKETFINFPTIKLLHILISVRHCLDRFPGSPPGYNIIVFRIFCRRSHESKSLQNFTRIHACRCSNTRIDTLTIMNWPYTVCQTSNTQIFFCLYQAENIRQSSTLSLNITQWDLCMMYLTSRRSLLDSSVTLLYLQQKVRQFVYVCICIQWNLPIVDMHFWDS